MISIIPTHFQCIFTVLDIMMTIKLCPHKGFSKGCQFIKSFGRIFIAKKCDLHGPWIQMLRNMIHTVDLFYNAVYEYLC